jgi:hypothetical protein
VAWVAERNIICLSCSDQTITLVLERHEGQTQEPKGYMLLGKLISNMLHRKLRWSPLACKLLSTSTSNALFFWDIDRFELTACKPTDGSGMLLDVIVLKDKGLIAISFLSGHIHLYSEDNFRFKGVLEGHTLGAGPGRAR